MSDSTTTPGPLRDHAEQFLQFAELSDDLMTVVDPEGRFLYVNPAARRVFGLAPEDCVGLSAWEFIHTSDADRTHRAFREWREGEAPSSFSFENRQVSRSGEVRHMLWTIVRFADDEGGVRWLTSCARDITAIRTAERSHRAVEERMRAVLAGVLDPLVTIDAHGEIQDASSSCGRLFGYAPEELVGRNIRLLMPEPHCSAHDGYLAEYRRTGATHILGRTREFPVLRKDGRQIDCELSVSRIDVPGQAEPVFCGSFRDVTARREAEVALATSERRFRAIFEQEFQFVALLTPEGVLLEVNRAALSVIDATREEVIGLPFWETPWWSHSEAACAQLKEAVRAAAGGEFVRFETTQPARDGRLLAIDFSLKPLVDEQGSVVMLLPEGRDVTAMKQAQQRETAMMRAFAEIGQSASLLAHEIKNPITSVNAALRAVANQLGEDERTVLSELVERMQRLEKLMRRTLSLARPVELRLAPCAPARLLQGPVMLMQPHLAEAGIELELDVEPDCPAVLVDEELIGDVLTNLIRNAIDAMEAGGRIRLAAAADGRGVRIRVDDDGPGIPESVLATVFKPFVSTKSNGTGLGLAIARKLVEAHGGEIEVHQSPLGGARFEIRLPAERRAPG